MFDDADLDAAVEGAIASKYRNAGQTCVCANRFFVHDSVYDAFAAKAAPQRVGKLKVGDGTESGVTQGPLINEAAVLKVEVAHRRRARAKARTVVDRRQASRARRHGFFEPTVLTGVTPDMKVASEETFGPVAPLFRSRRTREVDRDSRTTPSSASPRISTAAISAASGASPKRSNTAWSASTPA